MSSDVLHTYLYWWPPTGCHISCNGQLSVIELFAARCRGSLACPKALAFADDLQGLRNLTALAAVGTLDHIGLLGTVKNDCLIPVDRPCYNITGWVSWDVDGLRKFRIVGNWGCHVGQPLGISASCSGLVEVLLDVVSGRNPTVCPYNWATP